MQRRRERRYWVLNYDPKVTSLLRTLKMPALGQVEALDEAAVRAKVLGALSESTQLTDQVKAAAEQLRQRVDENDRMLRQLLDMERPGEPKNDGGGWRSSRVTSM